MTPGQLRSTVLAAALHDIGAFSLRERRDTFEFEVRQPHLHAETGYRLLRLFAPLSQEADIVRMHHADWNGTQEIADDRGIPLGSHVLHLADRVAVLVDRNAEILGQAPGIISRIAGQSGSMFMPGVVDAFRGVSEKEYFWLDLAAPPLRSAWHEHLDSSAIELGSDDMLGFSRLFSRIIDFKSPFTAAHSSGVASSAEVLAKLCGFSDTDCRGMRIAGYLHDLGKLAVPTEILDKPASLQRHERNMIRHHTFYTFRLLQGIPALERINRWASFHHERLDGTGYPFHLEEKDLPVGSQIMAVADVFTALAENQPYRAGMSREQTLRVLNSMAVDRALNPEIVAALASEFPGINDARQAAQSAAEAEYGRLRQAEVTQ